jgi:hypothetical protein
MKKFFYSIFTAIALLSAYSCTNLDEAIYSQLPAEGFFTDEESLLKNVGRAYAWLSSSSWSNGYLQHMGVWMNDMVTTDEGIIPYREGGLWWDNGVWIQDHEHSWDYRHDGVYRTYSFVMDGVSRCNQILYQMEQANVEFAGSEKLVAEVKMVRTYLYLKGIDWFRNLPLVTDFTDTSLPSQVSPETLFNFIESEINENVQYLEDCPTASNYGRITKVAAYTMLAKLYINAETWIGKPMWSDASAACDKVMQYSSLKLEPDYFTCFCVNNETSTETIWAIPLEASITSTFPIHNITLQTLSQKTFNIKNFCWDGACALEWLWYAYEDNDARRASWLEGPQYAKDGSPLMVDPNRQLTYTPYVGPIYNQTDPALLDSGVRMCKWEYEDGLAYQAMSNDFPIYRLSDIYLLKAECLMRQNGGTATTDAVKYANYVRTRAGATPYTTATLTLEELLIERARELCWEGHRRQDQVRFGTFSKPWDNKTNTDAYRDIYPIPYRAMNTNANLKQNPGY